MKKITLKNIADELGVSKGTVDRAIHNRPGISDETRNKILCLIEKYGYKPDKVARFLSLKDRHTKIGVISKIDPQFFWDNVKRGIDAAHQELSDFGLEIDYKGLNNDNYAAEIIISIQEMIDKKMDAIIVVPVNNIQTILKINEACDNGILVATLNDDISNSRRCFYLGPQMSKSGRTAGELMGRFLNNKGNILIINGNIESLEYKERLKGFYQVIKEHYSKIKIVDCYTYDYKENAAVRDEKFKSLLQKNPTINGIYDVDGASLYDVGNTIKEYKKLKDIVLIGHEISNKVEELIKDGVIDACISQNPYSQGYSAVKMAFDYIVQNEKPLSHNMYTRIDIIVRENIADHRNIINPY